MEVLDQSVQRIGPSLHHCSPTGGDLSFAAWSGTPWMNLRLLVDSCQLLDGGCEGSLGFLGWVHFWVLGAAVVVLVAVVAFRAVC
jgi:hypothetical protein